MDAMLKIFEKLDPNGQIFTEETKKEICKIFEDKIKSIKEDEYKRAYEIVESKIKALDEEHADALKKFVATMDESYCSKLKFFAEAIDKDHTEKLKKAVEITKKTTTDEKLVESISNFMDEYIVKALPETTVVNEEKLKRLEKFHKSVTEAAIITSDKFHDEIKEAVCEAQEIIESKSKENDKLIFENIELKKKLETLEATNLLESKTKDLSPKEKAYLESYFSGLDKVTIEEKFNEARKAYKTDETQRRQKIVESAESKTKIINPVTLTEGNENVKSSISIMDIYTQATSKLGK